MGAVGAVGVVGVVGAAEPTPQTAAHDVEWA